MDHYILCFALTTGPHRRIVLEVAHSNETAPNSTAIGQASQPPMQPPGALGTLTTRTSRQLPRYRQERGNGRSTQMARGTTSAVAEHDTKQPKAAAHRRHAGPYGASFDGTD